VSDSAPQPYHVTYSERVRRRLVALAKTARARADGPAFVAALEEFDRRLHIYPQFGDPQCDLTREPGQVRIGIVPPLTMRYAVFEERREVTVMALPVLLRKSGG
jgi:hypothetical protein